MSWRALAAEVLSGEPQETVLAPATVSPTSLGGKQVLALVSDGRDAHTPAPLSVAAPPPGGLVDRLAAMRAQSPPGGLSPLRWANALGRAEAALWTWGGAAAAFGWTADDLLGVDPAAWMRLDRRGALLLYPEADVVGVTEAELIIRAGRTVFRIQRRSAT